MNKFKYLIDEDIQINDFREILENNNKPILIIGIGTPKMLLDSVGPYIATNLQVRGFKVRGTLKMPIHALNIRKFLKTINLDDYFVIAIDASAGSDIGSIIVQNGPLHPGAAAGKRLPSIGDMAIKLIVATKDDFYDKSSEAINNVLNNDPNNLRDMFLKKVLKMFKQLRGEGLI